ncbi:MAG: hypothetical protein B6I35_13425 [Anaerolineaceae bacterium 4572_32.2]|nr:MAG: hypothetical protein B6I35_13425 [Anaerolineaceae bacterium 4572_32.2]
MSIVNSDDTRQLTDALMKKGHSATTISTTGGFLRQGNATLIIGVQDENVDDVLDIIHRNCRTRSQYVNPMPPIMESGELYMPSAVEVQVGGAVVFVLDISRVEKF